MDREAWWATVHRVAELDMIKGTQRARAHTVRSLGWEDPLEKRKSTHSNILA